MLTEYEARILQGQLKQHWFQTRRCCVHFQTGKAKTASQLLDVSFNRSDEKMSGCKRSRTQTSRRGTESCCCLCVATENFLSVLLELFHIQMWHYSSLKRNNVKIVFLKGSWGTCFFLPAPLLQLPIGIINSKPRWVKAHCGAGRLSHWSKPLQTHTLRRGCPAGPQRED